jgi:microcystin-dependent protein
MSDPYIGEIRLVGFNFAPVSWAFCNGQLMSISEYEALFNLIGTTYGGDGQTTFALPDLRSRIPIHQGNGFVQGQAGGTETVTVTLSQIPSHSHVPQANSGGGTSNNPAGNVWANWSGDQYSDQLPSSQMQMNAGVAGFSGGGQPHNNIPPYLAVNFIICLVGIFPSQS